MHLPVTMATPILSGPQFPHLHNEMGGEQRRDYVNHLGDSTGRCSWVSSELWILFSAPHPGPFPHHSPPPSKGDPRGAVSDLTAPTYPHPHPRGPSLVPALLPTRKLKARRGHIFSRKSQRPESWDCKYNAPFPALKLIPFQRPALAPLGLGIQQS